MCYDLHKKVFTRYQISIFLNANEVLIVMFPCPSCGFLIFDEPFGSYAICSICGWEDDPVQLEHPLLSGGANDVSLLESQQKILKEIPPVIKEYNGYLRDAEWRPLSQEDYADNRADIRNGEDYFNAAANSDETKYYWQK